METGLHRQDRVPVIAAYLAPFVGLPLLGPWVLHASLAESSPARPHVARAFDLHLAAIILSFASLVLGSLLFGYPIAEIVVGAILLVATVVDVILLVGALWGTRWSNPWQPVILGGRKFYRQQPFQDERPTAH